MSLSYGNLGCGGLKLKVQVSNFVMFEGQSLSSHTLDSLINVLHAYLFLRIFSYHHNVISLHIFFTLGVIHAKMLLMV